MMTSLHSRPSSFDPRTASCAASIDQRFNLGPFGRGWRHNFQFSISQPETNLVEVIPPVGAHRLLTQQPTLSWQGQPGESGTLQESGGAFTLREADGRVYSFDLYGKLIAVQYPDGNQVSLNYSGVDLASVVSSDGRSFSFSYNADNRISSLTDSAGSQLQYNL